MPSCKYVLIHTGLYKEAIFFLHAFINLHIIIDNKEGDLNNF